MFGVSIPRSLIATNSPPLSHSTELNNNEEFLHVTCQHRRNIFAGKGTQLLQIKKNIYVGKIVNKVKINTCKHIVSLVKSFYFTKHIV